jgi:hypothetical protein
MIRSIRDSDTDALLAIHQKNGLPDNCFPDLGSPLALVKICAVDADDKPIMAATLHGTAELYLLVDHEFADAPERWRQLREMCDVMKRLAWEKGLDAFSCWVPTSLEKSFGKRLAALGFQPSPWHSWTMPLV